MKTAEYAEDAEDLRKNKKRSISLRPPRPLRFSFRAELLNLNHPSRGVSLDLGNAVNDSLRKLVNRLRVR